MDKIFGWIMDTGVLLCFFLSCYYTAKIASISWAKEEDRQIYVHNADCARYGSIMNWQAGQLNTTKPCKDK